MATSISLVRAAATRVFALALAFFAFPAFAGQVSLAWNASTSSTVTGYKVHVGTTSRSYSSHIDVGASVSATVPNLTSGTTYYYAVTAYNSAGVESSYSNEASSTIPTATTAAPAAAFTATSTSGVAPLATTFTSTSTGSITSYAWNFGDGSSGSGASVSHSYTSAGTYTATLTVTGAGGSTSAAKTITVSASTTTGTLAANFTGNRLAGTAPMHVAFNDASTGTVNSYSWNFGDGVTSTDPNPIHTYKKPGSFTVSLTVTGPAGTKTATRSAYVTTVAANDLVVDFGAGKGLYTYANGATWAAFDSRSVGGLAMADLGHDGKSELIVGLAPTASGKAQGIWAVSQAKAWSNIGSATATKIVVGDMDGNGQDDVVVSVPGLGLFLKMNGGSSWTKFDTRSTTKLVFADLNHDGKDELIADFGSGGIYSYTSSTGWKLLVKGVTTWMITADVDGNDQPDLVVNFGSTGGTWGDHTGVWVLFNGTTWFQVDPDVASVGAAASLDGGTKDALVLVNADGTYIYKHSTPVGTNLTAYKTTDWTTVSATPAKSVIAADLDSDGKQDLVADFGTKYGIMKYQLGKLVQINTLTAGSMVSGQYK